MTEEGGIICLLCQEHCEKSGKGGSRQHNDVNKPAFPTRRTYISEHLSSDRHLESMQKEQLKRSSVFHEEFLHKEENKLETTASRFQMVYWLLKEEISNRKLKSLQDLVDEVGNNVLLSRFSHTSSYSVSEMIFIIGDYLKSIVLDEIREAGFWSSLVDESTDVSNFQQFITFVRYLKNGKPLTRFLDTRRVDADGANARNLHRIWNEVVLENQLDMINHVGLSCDGAAVMLGKKNSLAEKIKAVAPSTIVTNCHSHRLALTCSGSIEAVKEISDFESILLQLWKFFAASPKRYAKLQSVKKEDRVHIKLKRACKTRWLSHEQAVFAAKEELVYIWEALEWFQDNQNDAMAAGLLQKIKSKEFVFILYILHHVLQIMKSLSLLFQHDGFSVHHIESSLQQCLWSLEDISQSSEIVDSLKKDWEKYTPGLTQMNSADEAKVSSLTSSYCNELRENLHLRFPQTEILTAFSALNCSIVPSDLKERKSFGLENISILWEKLQGCLQQTKEQTIAEYQCLKEYVKTPVFADVSNIEGSLQLLSTDKCLKIKFPSLCDLSKVALTLPISNAWPERGFSALTRIKSKARNRLLDTTLRSLLQVSMNGPSRLTKIQTLALASRWHASKDRRTVSTPIKIDVQDIDDDDDDDDGDCYGFTQDEMYDSDKVWI